MALAMWRRVASSGFRTLVAAALVGAILLIPDRSSARPSTGTTAPAANDDEATGDAGVIVRSETVEVWLPESLRELASPVVRARALAEPDGLRRVLGRRGGDPRIALTTRCHRADGEHSDITFILRPLDVPDHLERLREALAGVADVHPGDVADDGQGPDAHLVPEGLLDRDQDQILATLDRILAEEQPEVTR
ncbi:hypothetical protein OJF2_73670 [Aquisphaera giovannonii]|uniref:Uncharacterized protein n=1 Tax=Aquisphaera giovannonii TaxID=406548 RepID=A0A5B9WFK7_9BACT|nr:hypothetical protein [Aquisphaera giovannonii]QEH38761.1 hypothetical protein OJF2_73670 [Aquisphaera giovannonii]